jgi:hypothetical protein
MTTRTFPLTQTATCIAAALGQPEGPRGPIYQQLHGWKQRGVLASEQFKAFANVEDLRFDDTDVARFFLLLTLHDRFQQSFEGLKNLSGWLRTTSKIDFTGDINFARCFEDIRNGSQSWDMVIETNKGNVIPVEQCPYFVRFELSGNRGPNDDFYSSVSLNKALAPIIAELAKA